MQSLDRAMELQSESLDEEVQTGEQVLLRVFGKPFRDHKNELLDQGDPEQQPKYNLQLELACGVRMLSQRQEGVPNPLVIHTEPEGVSLMGINMSVDLDEFGLEGFVYEPEEQLLFQNLVTFNSGAKNKSHLLHLLIDEMAWWLLYYKAFFNNLMNANVFDLFVVVRLRDAWEAKPPINVVSAVNAPQAMNSLSRYLLMTGTPSYYTRFGFNRAELHGEEASVERARDAKTKQKSKLNQIYHCMRTDLAVPQVYNSQNDCHQLFQNLPLNNDYEKMFVVDVPVTFFGAHGLTESQFTLNEYFQKIILRGEYPNLQTMQPKITFESSEGRKRMRADLGAF